MRIGFIQMTPVFGDVEANVQQAVHLIRSAPADLLVLPEFFNSGYLFTDRIEVENLSETVPDGYTVRTLQQTAQETGTAIVAGLPEKDGLKFYNTAALITPGKNVYRYRKTHLFDREKLFFTPGDTGFKVFEWSGVRIGIMICFDWYFPESARTLALAGAHIIAHPSNLVLPHCPRAMVTRCLENRVFAVTSNRSGTESRGDASLRYIGNSRIIDPLGNVLSAADEEPVSIKIVDINPLDADHKNVTGRNNLFEDRRIDLYNLKM